VLSGLTEKIEAMFPPFRMPGFTPNYTGYDLDQEHINWKDMYDKMAPNHWLIYVRLVNSVLALNKNRYTTAHMVR